MATGWFLQVVLAAALLLAIRCDAFSSSCRICSRRGDTRLGSQFINGGYDPSVVVSAKWSPLEAAEFVIWHSSQADAVGRQLHPLVQTWGGEQVGEFVTRLFLTQKHQDSLTLESRHVRTPQWHGLEEEPGLEALHDLLQAAIPDAVVQQPMEFARFAKFFLWKEHTWPAAAVPSVATAADPDADADADANPDATAVTTTTTSKQPLLPRNVNPLESDSFAKLGYTVPIVQMWKQLRQDRFDIQQELQHPLHYHAKDLVQVALEQTMTTNKTTSMLPFAAMQQFFQALDIHVKPAEKVEIVQGLAKGGWTPANIAKFVSIIPEAHDQDGIPNVAIARRRGKKKPQDTVSISLPRGWSTVPPAEQSNMTSSLRMIPVYNHTTPYFGTTNGYLATSMEHRQHL
jgi:hypothetical protein